MPTMNEMLALQKKKLQEMYMVIMSVCVLVNQSYVCNKT
jgi:hypothetical protein